MPWRGRQRGSLADDTRDSSSETIAALVLATDLTTHLPHWNNTRRDCHRAAGAGTSAGGSTEFAPQSSATVGGIREPNTTASPGQTGGASGGGLTAFTRGPGGSAGGGGGARADCCLRRSMAPRRARGRSPGVSGSQETEGRRIASSPAATCYSSRGQTAAESGITARVSLSRRTGGCSILCSFSCKFQTPKGMGRFMTKRCCRGIQDWGLANSQSSMLVSRRDDCSADSSGVQC